MDIFLQLSVKHRLSYRDSCASTITHKETHKIKTLFRLLLSTSRLVHWAQQQPVNSRKRRRNGRRDIRWAGVDDSSARGRLRHGRLFAITTSILHLARLGRIRDVFEPSKHQQTSTTVNVLVHENRVLPLLFFAIWRTGSHWGRFYLRSTRVFSVLEVFYENVLYKSTFLPRDAL